MSEVNIVEKKEIQIEWLNIKAIVSMGNITLQSGSSASTLSVSLEQAIEEDPAGFVKFAEAINEAILEGRTVKGRGPDKQKRKARKEIHLDIVDELILNTLQDKPHLETRVGLHGNPSMAAYGGISNHAPTLKEALEGLKGFMSGIWPDTLTQEEKAVITEATGEIFEK